jgi:CheY-like chemotaxis protein
VLVADPDARRAALYGDLVEARGFRAIVTRNGDEAKAMLQRRELPVLLVANLSLPRIDGFTLIAELRRVSAVGGPPAIVIASSKELTAAAWNLKDRLGIADVLPGDAPGDQGARCSRACCRPRCHTSPRPPTYGPPAATG